jgi:carboxyl-terminal processing protease
MKAFLAVVAVLTLVFQPLRANDAPGPVIGIGTELKAVEGGPVVANVIHGSPADKAGVRANDKIVKVDDRNVAGLSLNRVAHLLRGEQNSEVHLTVDRGGAQKIFAMKREILLMPHP